jgi:hypothetical protein
MSYTMDIDPDLLQKLEAEATRTGRTVSELIHLLLSQGLEARQRKATAKFEVKPRALHAYPGVDFTSTSRLLDSLDEERLAG